MLKSVGLPTKMVYESGTSLPFKHTPAAISAFCLSLCLACSSDPAEPGLPDLPVPAVVLFDGSEIDRVCNQMQDADIQNVVRDAFCVDPRPEIRNLRDLQRALMVGCPDATADGHPYTDPFDPLVVALPERLFECDDFALSFMSSSLVMRQTSPLNPRALLFRDDDLGFRAMAFVRGEHFVEFIAENRNTAPEDGTSINFFLFPFRQACTEADTCTNADLFSSRIESSWTGLAIQSEQDLANTPLDCLQCHTSGEPNTPAKAALLFQEIERPWPHWMSPLGFDLNEEANFTPAGFQTELPNKRAFADAYPNDAFYAGIPVGLILTRARPSRLELAIQRLGYGDGFNPDADTSSGDDESRFRRLSFAEAQALNESGLTIQPPTRRSGDLMDPAKKTRVIEGFVAFRDGTADDLPDPTDVFFSGHAEEYERLSLRARPGATGEEIVRQACLQCHNDYLDQNLPRARFNAANLESMSTETLQVAQQRIGLSIDTYGVMPPSRLRRLGPDERLRAQEYLQTLIDRVE